MNNKHNLKPNRAERPLQDLDPEIIDYHKLIKLNSNVPKLFEHTSIKVRGEYHLESISHYMCFLVIIPFKTFDYYYHLVPDWNEENPGYNALQRLLLMINALSLEDKANSVHLVFLESQWWHEEDSESHINLRTTEIDKLIESFRNLNLETHLIPVQNSRTGPINITATNTEILCWNTDDEVVGYAKTPKYVPNDSEQ